MVDTGSSQDPLSKTGLAHMMEHMAFKGTPDIGTTNYAEEKVALAKVEQAYAAYEAERIKRIGQRSAEAGAAAERVAGRHQGRRQVRAQEPVRRDRGEPRRRGHERLHQLRRNRLHVLDAVEHDRAVGGASRSDRFANPVMREFYKERNVVMEERRMRTDSDPTGRLIEQFLGTAFAANPYHRPTIGYASDLQAFSATDAENFFHRYYVPSNMVIALVGDLDPAQGHADRGALLRPASHQVRSRRS